MSKTKSGIRRWFIFNSVGAMGIVVQMSALFLLTHFLGMNYLPATALAVEAAVLHNFFWHQRWTWSDRMAGQRPFLRLLLGFHLTNGALSIAGNMALMRIFVGSLGLNFMLANALAITLCSVLNFLAGDRIVFRNPGNPSLKGGTAVENKTCRILKQVSFLFTLTLLPAFCHAPAQAAELQTRTVQAWQATVERAEHRISSELESNRGFLALDFQDSRAAAEERLKVLAGDIPVKQLSGDDGMKKIGVPNGMIHHWRGSVFIPGASLDTVMLRVANPRLEDTKQEDVLDSKVLESQPGQLKLFLKLQRSKIVTVVYNTEHSVRYRRHGESQASSSSVATKIAEVEKMGDGREREKPEGRDHGFLWRMNSYWRYQEIQGGVIVECESMTLSRSIPPILEYMIRPIIKSVARESMRRTLDSLRTRLTVSSLRAENTQ